MYEIQKVCMDRKGYFCYCEFDDFGCFVIFFKDVEVLYEIEMYDFL